MAKNKKLLPKDRPLTEGFGNDFPNIDPYDDEAEFTLAWGMGYGVEYFADDPATQAKYAKWLKEHPDGP